MRTIKTLLFLVALAACGQELNCKCTKLQGDEYLCKCTAATVAELPDKLTTTVKGPTPTEDPSARDASKGRYLDGEEIPKEKVPAAKPATETGASTGTTATGLPIYTGPRGGRYHYSPSGKKVYERKK